VLCVVNIPIRRRFMRIRGLGLIGLIGILDIEIEMMGLICIYV
jgi:hypothetical protein